MAQISRWSEAVGDPPAYEAHELNRPANDSTTVFSSRNWKMHVVFEQPVTLHQRRGRTERRGRADANGGKQHNALSRLSAAAAAAVLGSVLCVYVCVCVCVCVCVRVCMCIPVD